MNRAIRSDRWLPWVTLGAFTLFWVLRWPSLPLLLDHPYHLFVAREFVDAGGPITYEPWEYAPVGRPHLYPPVVHLLLAGFLQSGCSPVAAIRLMSVAMVPALLLSIFLVVRRLLTPRLGLISLWIGMLPFAFHLQSTMALAATLASIDLLWLMEAISRRRLVAAGSLLGLLWYVHLGVPWMSLVMLSVYGLMTPSARPVLARALWGLFLATPWLAHLWHGRAYLHVVSRHENAMIEIMPLLYAAACLGAWRCWRLKERYHWLLACWLGFALLAARHPYRWLSGEGMLPVILLAAVGVEWCVDTGSRLVPESPRNTIAAMAIGMCFLISPTAMNTPKGLRWAWSDSGPFHLLRIVGEQSRVGYAEGFQPYLQQLATSVAAHSKPDEILWSNAPNALGLVAALAHRATSSAMLDEVPPSRRINPIAAAHLIVWFKFEPIQGAMPTAQLARYPLTKVAEDDVAILYRQSGVTQTARPPRRVMPGWVAWVLLSTAVAAIAWDLSRHDARMPV